MNILNAAKWQRGGTFAALIFSSLVLAACAIAPSSPPGAAEVRSKLSELQRDSNLASHARVELREAEEAVRIAEQPLSSAESSLGKHRVYMADHKVEIARAKATTRYAEEQRSLLGEERERARLAARTREADRARVDAEYARDEAGRARREADAARAAAADAAREAEELQRQIDALQAEVTDRGLVLTLGDVLFATASAELKGGAHNNLNRLVNFLNQYPDRHVQIEGHTDNVGSAEYNQGLSQRRADSVRYYLIQQGIASQRLSTSGMGLHRPVASNDTAIGRQQNRRVEIIIDNPSQPPAVIGSPRQ